MSRVEQNEKGVLVLSEFTGSAVELDRAVLVNPHDIDGMAATIEKAITMPAQEQTRRMRSLRQRVRNENRLHLGIRLHACPLMQSSHALHQLICNYLLTLPLPRS